jgi:hypothetical protein
MNQDTIGMGPEQGKHFPFVGPERGGHFPVAGAGL